MMPAEDEPIDYTINDQTRSQVGFLVEARSRSGYSGSPVFWLERNMRDPRLIFADTDLRLIGVDWGHIPEDVPLVDPSGIFHGQHWKVQVHSGMMGVVPIWYLEEFVRTSPRLIEQRQRDDDYYRAHPATGVPDGT
jgi:hypothetical protein